MAIMRSGQTYNDDTWHSATLERQGNEGRLSVDGYLLDTNQAEGNGRFIDLEVSRWRHKPTNSLHFNNAFTNYRPYVYISILATPL